MFFENNYVTVDMDNFPLILVKIKNHTPTDVEFDEFLIALVRTYAINKDRVIIYDILDNNHFAKNHQLKYFTFLQENKAQTEKYLKGAAVITKSKEFIEGINIFKQKLMGKLIIEIFSDRELAFDFLKEKLKEISDKL